MKVRLFLQKLWNKEKDWDDTIDKKDTGKWREIMEEAKELSTMEVPRHIGGKNHPWFCICDALKDTQVAAIYLKTIDEEKNIELT